MISQRKIGFLGCSIFIYLLILHPAEYAVCTRIMPDEIMDISYLISENQVQIVNKQLFISFWPVNNGVIPGGLPQAWGIIKGKREEFEAIGKPNKRSGVIDIKLVQVRGYLFMVPFNKSFSSSQVPSLPRILRI